MKSSLNISIIFLVLANGLLSFPARHAGTSESPGTVIESLSGLPDTAKYQIDAGQSNFLVHASVGGLFSSFGHDHNIAIRGISGEAGLNGDATEQSWVHMRIRADSLAVTDKVSEKDRQAIEQTMRDETLETGKYPEIIFTSTRVEISKKGGNEYQAKIWGDLALHGVTNSGLITAHLTVNGNNLRARGEFPLRMTDYGIKPPSVAGGAIKVKDMLKFTFDIVAHSS